VSELSSEPITELLAKWQAGDEEAFRALVPRVYKELRRLAHPYLQKERPGCTSWTAGEVAGADADAVLNGGRLSRTLAPVLLISDFFAGRGDFLIMRP